MIKSLIELLTTYIVCVAASLLITSIVFTLMMGKDFEFFVTTVLPGIFDYFY